MCCGIISACLPRFLYLCCHRSCGHSLQSERWSDTVTSSHHSHWNTLTLATVAAPYGHSSPLPWILVEWLLCIGTRHQYTALWHQASGSTVLGADYGIVCMLNSLTAHSLFALCFMTHSFHSLNFGHDKNEADYDRILCDGMWSYLSPVQEIQ